MKTALLERPVETSPTPIARTDSRQILEKIRVDEQSLVKSYRDAIESFDAADRENWPTIIKLARKARVSDEEMLRELGSSPSTIHRWASGETAPRDGTRRLMKRALLELLDDRLLLNDRLQEESPPALRTRRRQVAVEA